MNNLKTYLGAAVGFLLFAAVIAFSVPQNALSLAAAAAKSDVRVINTAAEPVPVSVQGTTPVTGTVAISNQPTVALASNQVEIANQQPIVVRPVREPFQQIINVGNTINETCDFIEVPDGKRLTIESFSADVTSGARPIVYLRVRYARPGGSTNFGRSVMLDMLPRGEGGYSGHTATLLHSGSPSEPQGNTFNYEACLQGNGTFSTMSAFVSGWLE